MLTVLAKIIAKVILESTKKSLENFNWRIAGWFLLRNLQHSPNQHLTDHFRTIRGAQISATAALHCFRGSFQQHEQ